VTGAAERLVDRMVEAAVTRAAIGPARLPHVFDPFTQEEQLRTRSYGGLAIAKHLVELQGGSIRAESAGEEKGTTFPLELRGVPSPSLA